MDLKNLKRTEGVRVLELRNPHTSAVLTQEGTNAPVTISLISADAPEYRALVHKQNNARIKEMRVARKGLGGITSESTDASNLELLVLATKAWSGIVENGQALQCTPDVIRYVYTEYPWIREQAEEFVNERANFLGE